MIWYAIKYRMSQGALFLEKNIDYLLLGKILPSNVLGHYAFSYNIMYTPVKRISKIFKDVLFPSLSKLKNNKESILNYYFRSLQIVAFVSFPSMLLIAFNAEYVIVTIFGQHWVEAVPIVEILCFAGAFQSVGQFGDVVFDSIGKPEISFYLAITRMVFIIFSISLGVTYGILVIGYLITLSKILSLILILYLIRCQIKFQIRTLWEYVKGTVYCIFALILSQIFFKEILNYNDSLIKLATQLLLASLFIFISYRDVLADLLITIKSKTTG